MRHRISYRAQQAAPLLLVALVVMGLAPVAAQDGEMPVITPDNAHQLAVMNALWRGTVDAVAWSPRGDLIAVGTSLSVWLYDADALDAKPRLLPIERGRIVALEFSPDGTFIAASLSYDVVLVWDMATGEQVARLESGYQSGTIAWGPDGTWIAVQWANPQTLVHAIQIWDVAQGTRIESISAGEANIWHFALSPDGSMIAASTRDGLMVWDRAADRHWVARAIDPSPTIDDVHGWLAFSPDNATFLLATWDQQLIAYDAATLDAHVLQADAGAIYDIAYSPDGEQVLTVGDVLALRDAATGEALATAPYFGYTVAFSPDGTRFTVPSKFGAVEILDTKTGAIAAYLEGFSTPVIALSAREDGQIVMLHDFSLLWAWDGTSSTATHIMGPGASVPPITDAAFSADGSRLVFGDAYGDLTMVDAHTGHTVFTAQANGSPIIAVAYSADSTRIVSLHQDGALRLWDSITGAEIALLDQWRDPWHTQLAFSPNGALLAAIQYGETLMLYDIPSRTQIAKAFLIDDIDSIAFSPDGAQIAASWAPGGIVVWDVDQMHGQVPVDEATPYYETIGGGPIVYNPGGTLLAASDGDTLRVFDVATGAEVFSAYADTIDALAWTPDGSRIITGGLGGVVRVWGIVP